MPVVGGKTIEVLFTPEEIAGRNLELARAIAARGFHDLLTISILKGSFIFAADLIRAMHDAGVEPDVEFITVSSYGKGTTSTEVRLLRDIDSDVRDRDVLLGRIGDTPFYISESQYEAWKNTDLVIDVVPGRGGMFSLDNGREKRFLTRSTVCGV